MSLPLALSDGSAARERAAPASGGCLGPESSSLDRMQVHVVIERRAKAVAGEMPPSRGRDARGISASGAPPVATSRCCSISARKIFVSAAIALWRSARKPRNRFGTEITHCRTGTGGMT
jgi:hypothetical protein